MKKLSCLIALFGLLLFCSASSNLSEPIVGYEVGSQIKDFTLKDVSGKMVTLSDIDNTKGYIVIFSCNTCPIVKLYEERMVGLHYKYASQGYPVVAINSNDKVKQPGDSFEEMQKYHKEKNFPFLYLYDETQEIAKTFGATRTPHVYLVKKEKGKMNVAYIGAIDDSPQDVENVDKNYVANAIDNVLAGKSVKKTKTKAVGCSIKWKAS